MSQPDSRGQIQQQQHITQLDGSTHRLPEIFDTLNSCSSISFLLPTISSVRILSSFFFCTCRLHPQLQQELNILCVYFSGMQTKKGKSSWPNREKKEKRMKEKGGKTWVSLTPGIFIFKVLNFRLSMHNSAWVCSNSHLRRALGHFVPLLLLFSRPLSIDHHF